MEPWDPDGPGPAAGVLVAAGNFQLLGAGWTGFVAEWDGSSWSPMGSGVDGTVDEVGTFDPDGPGPLNAGPVIGGVFTMAGVTPVNHIARWDGSEWAPMGSGLAGTSLATVRAMIPYGDHLVIGGLFTSVGGVPMDSLARWDGFSWSPFPGELDGGPRDLELFNGELIAAGYWGLPKPPWTNGILRWNGKTWTTLGPNFPIGSTNALTVYRGELIAGGNFEACCPPQPGNHVAAFDGVVWKALGSGINGAVRTLTVFDPDGPGPAPDLLIAGGSFTQAGGQPAFCLAAWDGQSWSALGASVNGPVEGLAVFNGQLAVGGYFTTAGGQPSPYFARWGCPQTPPCYPDCSGEGVLTVADFGCFQTRFVAGNSYADCNADGTLTVADFGCFQTRFVLGCP